MNITENKVVTVTYVLHANLPTEDRRHIETADSANPLKFIFGVGMMIPGFEEGLVGKTIGDTFSFSINPENAYGEVDEQALVDLPIDIFKVDGAVDFGMLAVGNTLPMSDGQGNVLNGKVLSYNDQVVKMDFNSPLAGHTLHFSGEVLEVREATPEEIDHGHVH
ncbi:MAG: peptidylprolyl isomerase [Bacteroidota bacterium]